ncbi:hypothetical protein CNY89_24185, partial [Amaricoccus sp. HAR-UPW-R2A-40]
YHRNILIENNYIHSTNKLGITVAHGDGVVIRNNTVLHNDDMGFNSVPLINVSLLSRNVDIIGNTVYSVQKCGEFFLGGSRQHCRRPFQKSLGRHLQEWAFWCAAPPTPSPKAPPPCRWSTRAPRSSRSTPT